VAREALRVIVEEELSERSRSLGSWFLSELQTIRHAAIREIRGTGLLVGIDLNTPARPYCERLMELGILCKETHSHVIRLAPPLVISQDDLAWAVGRIRSIFA
jgi:ornithine--oxo-acid transaminase